MYMACGVPATIRAQTSDGASTVVATAKMQRQVVKACPADFAKFCPGQQTTDWRSMTICLKFYRSDLSLNCRAAIIAATR
ncbi:MAG: hypothetical protein WDN49_17875 [Acetobacteraceae bacterium]